VAKEMILLGIAIIIIGISVYFKTYNIWWSLGPLLIGAALIVFNREEDKMEKRKDI